MQCDKLKSVLAAMWFVATMGRSFVPRKILLQHSINLSFPMVSTAGNWSIIYSLHWAKSQTMNFKRSREERNMAKSSASSRTSSNTGITHRCCCTRLQCRRKIRGNKVYQVVAKVLQRHRNVLELHHVTFTSIRSNLENSSWSKMYWNIFWHASAFAFDSLGRYKSWTTVWWKYGSSDITVEIIKTVFLKG